MFLSIHLSSLSPEYQCCLTLKDSTAQHSREHGSNPVTEEEIQMRAYSLVKKQERALTNRVLISAKVLTSSLLPECLCCITLKDSTAQQRTRQYSCQ
jgi:hypothetical protein